MTQKKKRDGTFESYLVDGLLSCFRGCKRDERVAAIQIGQGVHHEPQVPDGSALFEQGDELVFVNVARDFATKDLRVKVKGKRVKCAVKLRFMGAH